MLKTKEEVEQWLKQHDIQKYTVNEDLTVDVPESVYLDDCFRPQNESEWLEQVDHLNVNCVDQDKEDVRRQDDGTYERGGSTYEFEPKEFKPYELPIQFGVVKGNFSIENNNLASLKGCPREVTVDFDCACSELTSLEGAPRIVGRSFHASSNKLTSLSGAPESVGQNFTCRNNKLTTLQGAPAHIPGNFDCSANYLHTLEGAPKTVGHNFTCYENPLENLNYAPEKVGRFFNSNGNFPELATARIPTNVSSEEYTAIAERIKLERQLAKLVEPYNREKEGPLPSELATKPRMKHKI